MWRMKTYLRCGNPLGGSRSENERKGVIKGLIYPIVDTLCGRFRNRFFAVSCWTKFLDGCEDSAGGEHEAGTDVHG